MKYCERSSKWLGHGRTQLAVRYRTSQRAPRQSRVAFPRIGKNARLGPTDRQRSPASQKASVFHVLHSSLREPQLAGNSVVVELLFMAKPCPDRIDPAHRRSRIRRQNRIGPQNAKAAEASDSFGFLNPWRLLI